MQCCGLTASPVGGDTAVWVARFRELPVVEGGVALHTPRSPFRVRYFYLIVRAFFGFSFKEALRLACFLASLLALSSCLFRRVRLYRSRSYQLDVSFHSVLCVRSVRPSD